MQKILDVNNKEASNIYLEPCILLSVLLRDQEYRGWYMRQFFQLCAGIHHKGDLIYRNGYVKVYYESTRLDILRKLFSIKQMENVPGNNLLELVVSAVDADSYVMLDIDEFYIKDTYYFEKVHYYRKFLINGYDTDRYIVYAMSHDRFTNYRSFTLPVEKVNELTKCHRNSCDATNYGGHNLSVYKRRKLIQEENIDLTGYYLDQYRRYLEYKQNDFKDDSSFITYFYGIDLYDIVRDAFQLKLENIEKTDYRTLAILAEHKKLMSERLRYLQNKLNAEACFDKEIMEYENMHHLLKQATRNILIPYNFNMERKKEKYCSLFQILDQVKAKDKRVSLQMIDKLSCNCDDRNWQM